MNSNSANQSQSHVSPQAAADNVVHHKPPAGSAYQDFQADVAAINLAFGKAADHANKAVSCRVEAGRLLLDLRERVEAQGKGWWPWFEEAGFVRDRKDAEKVIALARDHTPEEAEEAAAKEREKARKRMARHRAAQIE